MFNLITTIRKSIRQIIPNYQSTKKKYENPLRPIDQYKNIQNNDTDCMPFDNTIFLNNKSIFTTIKDTTTFRFSLKRNIHISYISIN